MVTDIEIMESDTLKKGKGYVWNSVYEKVFETTAPTKLDWLTGLLVVPNGKMLQYVHMGYASSFESYLILEINEGNLNKEKIVTNDEYIKFKHKQFKAFKKTKEYKKIKAELSKKGRSRKSIDNFLEQYIIKYTSQLLTK